MAKAAEDYLDWKAQNTTSTDSNDPSLDNVPMVCRISKITIHRI